MTVRVWRAFLLLLTLSAILAAPAAGPSSAPKSAGEALSLANLLITKKDYPTAITLLTAATQRYPTEGQFYVLLAQCQQAQVLSTEPVDAGADSVTAFLQRLNRGNYVPLARDLFETYGKGLIFADETRPILQRVNDLLAYEYPVRIGQFGAFALPGNPEQITYTLSDPQLPTELRGAYRGLITTRPLPVTPPYVKDPKYGMDPSFDADPAYGKWEFQRMLLAYDYDRKERSWRLRFRVIWQDVPGKEIQRAQLARQCAILMLRLSNLLHAYTGMTPRFSEDGTVNVWLAEKGEAGGETFNDSIYLYQVGIPRTAHEWIRELAHEYGHEVLPPVGGYTKPEWAANGLLGERMFVRWLLLNTDPKTENLAWVSALNAQEFTEKRFDYLVRHFAALGPDAQAMRGTDRAAMDGFVGMACYLELTRGSHYLLSVLKGLSTPTYHGPKGFLDTIASQEAYFQSPDHAIVTLRLDALPANIPLWVYLREGTWKAELTGAAAPLAAVEVDGKPVKVAGATFTTPALTRGWHGVKITVEGDAAPAFSSVKLVRQ